MVAGSGHWCTSVMSESLFTELWPGRSLKPTTVRLVGCCNVDVSHESQSAENLLLIIVAGSGPCRLEGLAEPCQVRLEKNYDMPENIALYQRSWRLSSRKVWVLLALS